MKNPDPLVTCIIPTFNRPHLAPRAIRSALAQTHKKIEVIVIDDSSDVEASRALASLNLPVKYIVNTGKKGAPHARNIGLLEAKGDFVSFLDDDDLWRPDKVECQLKLLTRYPIVSCNYTFAAKGRLYRARRQDTINYKKMLYQNYLGSCSFVMVESGMLKDCFFDESLDCGQDWDMWLTVMKKNHITTAGNSPEYLVDYNISGHPRITNVSSVSVNCFEPVYMKRKSEYDEGTTKMFYLNNPIVNNRSFFLEHFVLLKKLRFEKRGFFSFIRMIVLRLFRIIEY